jgi:hypothetical protein
MEHTQMHVALKKGTKFSITLAILVEFYLEYISLELVYFVYQSL